MKKHKINISKMIFKSWDKHTEIWCRIAFMLMIPSALSRVFATICIIFGFVLLAIIRKGYEEYWHLDNEDKEKYHIVRYENILLHNLFPLLYSSTKPFISLSH